MPGMKCPKCGRPTFFSTPKGKQCSQCGHSMYVPPNNGKGGKGKKCMNCGKMTMFNGKCTNCGAKDI